MSENKEFIDKINKTLHYLFIAQTINDIVSISLLIATIIYKLFRQKTTQNIWIQIIMLLIAEIFYIINDSLNWIQFDRGEVSKFYQGDDSYFFWLTYCMSEFLYMLQHWIFAMSYFSVALNFKLIFSINTPKISYELRRN